MTTRLTRDTPFTLPWTGRVVAETELRRPGGVKSLELCLKCFSFDITPTPNPSPPGGGEHVATDFDVAGYCISESLADDGR